MQVEEYDDRRVLEEYVCKHFRNLLTRIEYRGLLLTGGGYYPHNPEAAEKADRITGPVDAEELKSALAQGVDSLRQRAVDRLLSEHAEQIRINRCPACHRIVRTPLAQQCMSCGHDWHHR